MDDPKNVVRVNFGRGELVAGSEADPFSPNYEPQLLDFSREELIKLAVARRLIFKDFEQQNSNKDGPEFKELLGGIARVNVLLSLEERRKADRLVKQKTTELEPPPEAS